MAAASIVEHGRLTLAHRVDVANDTGQILHTVTFSDVVTIISC